MVEGGEGCPQHQSPLLHAPPPQWLTLSPSCRPAVVVAETAVVEGGKDWPQHQIRHHPAGSALDHSDDDVSPQVMAKPVQQGGKIRR